MFRFRLRRKLIFCALIINVILIIVLNVFYLNKIELLPDFSVNASKNFIQKLVPAKPKRVLIFEIGRPKPEGKIPSCRFTQSEGLQVLAEKYLHPKDNALENGKCSKTYQTICILGRFGSSAHTHNSILVNCEQNPCKGTVKFGSLHKESGNIQWEDVRSSSLESFIKTVGLKSIDVMYPFFFLKCGDNNISSGEVNDFTQILSIPLIVAPSNHSTGQPSSKETINVNIVVLDSISRRHFFRSLPKTIEAFRMINLNPKSTSNVLDFELYQGATSGKGLLQYLTGKGDNKSGQSSSTKPLFTHFKSAGYQTLWQEDLCWMAEVGFLKYFGVTGMTSKDKWQKMKQVMKLNNIDSFGITHSCCLAFNENDVNARKSICVNGKLQHESFFEFLGRYLTEVDSNASIKPLFSITSLNLGDEETGSHVQILDNSLANFVQKMAGDRNTVTFLISDHGNNYHSFPVQTNEGQYEQYNPFLFMILPRFVERRLGESMKNLLNNQLRLLSVSDIYNTIKSLVDNKEEVNVTQDRGLFKEIDFDRNCEKLGLLSSSLCICDGWKSNQSPNVFHYIIAEFALGQLNNMIADQYLNQNPKNKEVPFAQCERLHGLRVMNISQKRIENGYIETEMDIYVQRNELFTVEVKWHGDDDAVMGMSLVNYHRKRIGATTTCSAHIDKDLCICQQGGKDLSKNVPNWKHYGKVFGRKSKSENRHGHCLYILTRDYTESTVFEAGNICANIEYDVRINFELDNMRTPTLIPVNVTIAPKSIQFLTFVTPLHLKNPGTWEYEIAISSTTKK